MPELPEVETIRRDLNKAIIGKTIKAVEIKTPKMLRPLTVNKIKQDLLGATITRADRRAKILILSLDTKKHLLVHLKMTGQLIFQAAKTKTLIVGGHPQKGGLESLPNKFTRAIFTFSDGSILYFNDLRKFGWLKTVSEAGLAEIKNAHGPEPLTNDFTLPYFETILHRFKNRPIKQLLLDQKLIAGLGNIYVDESLFRAKILPTRKSGLLKPAEVAALYAKIIEVLKLAIKKKGTSARNYRLVDGGVGGFVNYLNVYGRAGAACKVCGSKIKKIKLAGRGTHFCEKCQK